MSILKSIFGKKESSCCNVKIEEVKEEGKVQPNKDLPCCGKKGQGPGVTDN